MKDVGALEASALCLLIEDVSQLGMDARVQTLFSAMKEIVEIEFPSR